MAVLEIKEADFEEKVLNSKEKVVVDFYADWCGPCKMLSPIIDKLSTETTKYNFVKLNVDNAEKIAKTYGIMSIPALFVFENKEVIKSSIGFKSMDELKEFLEI